MKTAVRLAASILLASLCAAQAGAQPVRFPERPVRLVVAFAPGGNNDVPVRIVATGLAELWGVGVPVENRAGGGGTVGSQHVARAAADGYTLLNCNSATHGANPAMRSTLPYDAVRDFAPVAMIGSAPNVLLVPNASPIRSVREFLEAAKGYPDSLAVGTAGVGSTQHFSLELLRTMTGAGFVHAPYRGGSLALSDVVAGQLPAAITGLPTALAAIKAGKVRALAVTGPERSPHAPELPTFAEAGLPGYAVTTWTGLCAPAGTPSAIVERLNADVKRAIELPEIRRKLVDAGVDPAHLPAAKMAELIAAEVGRFTRIVAAAGIVPEN